MIQRKPCGCGLKGNNLSKNKRLWISRFNHCSRHCQVVRGHGGGRRGGSGARPSEAVADGTLTRRALWGESRRNHRPLQSDVLRRFQRDTAPSHAGTTAAAAAAAAAAAVATTTKKKAQRKKKKVAKTRTKTKAAAAAAKK